LSEDHTDNVGEADTGARPKHKKTN
jgi:hypothetical protein